MSYALLRRLPLGAMDRQVARAGMQICHKIVMQQLYISRAHAGKQWVVVSNPSDESVDLADFTLASANCSDVFRFPPNYILSAGEEVTVWCAPALLKLDEDTLLQPYLFWTKADGSLRSGNFFTQQQDNEILLLDPLLVEVASIRVARDGRKEFRVLHCKSAHPRTIRAEIDTRFCVSCLSPPEFNKRTAWPTPECGKITSPPPERREIYVFSRYWGVVSDRSLVEHFLAVFLVPVVEAFRALLIYLMLVLFLPTSTGGIAPHFRRSVSALLVMMLACDIIARRLMLCIKSGLLVTIASFTSFVLDRLAVVALYIALQRLYPVLSTSFHYMLVFDLGVGCVNAAAVHVRFLEARRDWHPLFKEFARWGHQSRAIVCVCGVGRELLLHLLLLLPFSTHPSPAWKSVGYVLVPLFTVASGVDFLRAVATLLHMVKYPIVQAIAQWKYLQEHPQYEEEEEEVDFEPEHEDGAKAVFQARSRKEDPPIAFFTPKSLRSRSLRPYS